AVGVDVGLHGALGGLAAGELRGARNALLAQPGHGGVDVAAVLLQRALAVHHPRAGALAQGLDVLGGDGHVGHWESSLVSCSFLGPPVVVAGASAGGGSSGFCSSRAGSALPVGASSTPFSTRAALVSGSSSAGFSTCCSPGE